MPVSKLTVPRTYAELRRAVENSLQRGQQAVELARLRTYWETGRYINAHVLQHQDRGNYGNQVLVRLAEELNTAKTTLYQCTQFARLFPIFRARGKLGWAHYRVLLAVPDEKQRLALAAEAEKKAWTSRQLELRVYSQPSLPPGTASISDSAGIPHYLLPIKRGTPGVYRVAAQGDTLAADLGFKLYLALDDSTAFKAGGFATFDARGRPQPAPDATKADLFTYPVAVRRVIDGDTLEVELALPRGYAHVRKLRLRALDCPEMDTPEGKAAKRFTEALVLPATAVEIVTSKPDKYDRYLADVFLTQSDGRVAYLNQELLTAAHAVRKTEWSASDWEK